jgi:taurine dioxygenase
VEFQAESLGNNLPFGAVIRNLDEAAIQSPQVRQALYDLWIDKGLLAFRGTKGDRATQVELSRIFGELEPHPVEIHRLPDFPELTRLHYDPDEGSIIVVDGEARGGYIPWHSDLVYVDRINRGGLLRPVTIPTSGGFTGFIDQIYLYDTLPADLKRRIEGRSIIYHTDGFAFHRKRFGKPVETLRAIESNRRNYDALMAYPRVAHPIVFEQAETGRKVLNVSPMFTQAIEGMDPVESDALCAEIVAHCEDESRAYFHDWQPGDMVLWDNWRMIHCAYGVPLDQHRTVERTTIKGDYALGRIISGVAVDEENLVDI